MLGSPETEPLVDEIYNRIRDLCEGQENHIAIALSLVSIKILNSVHKPELVKSDIKLIKENYPPASLKDIEEKSLSEEGLMYAIAGFRQASMIAMDYSPLTNASVHQKKDLSNESVRHESQELAVAAYKDMKKGGMSAFGCATTMILVGSVLSVQDGISPYLIARPLLEALGKVLDEVGPQQVTDEDMKLVEERAIAVVCQQMGISRKEALKYLEAARRMMANGEI